MALAVSDLYQAVHGAIHAIALNDMVITDPDTLILASNIVIESLLITCIQMKIYISAIGCYERCMAICSPFKHATDTIVLNIKKVVLLTSVALHAMNMLLWIWRNNFRGNLLKSPSVDTIMVAQYENVSQNITDSYETESFDIINSFFFLYQVQLLPAVLIMLITILVTMISLIRYSRNPRPNNNGFGFTRINSFIYILIISVTALTSLVPYVFRILRVEPPPAISLVIGILVHSNGLLNVVTFG